MFLDSPIRSQQIAGPVDLTADSLLTYPAGRFETLAQVLKLIHDLFSAGVFPLFKIIQTDRLPADLRQSSLYIAF